MRVGDVLIHLPDKVRYILQKITKNGYEAYAVGGCIRDSLLGKIQNDWDITTSATPEHNTELFSRTIDTGIANGTVTVLIEKEGFEITTYLIDGEYEDSRHPKEVIYTSNLIEDLKRRDFTINAMAYNDEDGLIDVFEGVEDMKNGIIRCVGNPIERFQEDALRMMRAIRFSAQLGYHIDENTQEAIRKLSSTLCNISVERIQVELVKLLTSNHPDYIDVAYKLGITKIILPLYDANHNQDHIKKTLKVIENTKYLRLAALFYQLDNADKVKGCLKQLKFDNKTIYFVSKLIQFYKFELVDPSQKVVRYAIHEVGEDIFPLLFPLRRADILARNDENCAEELEQLKEWDAYYQQVIKEEQCVSLKTLAVTGSDLIQNGFSPGKEMGELLQMLLKYVLDHPQENKKDRLLEISRKYFNIL